ncbi:pyruvate, orthophosphate dikinase [Micromonospora citrea]|uniref:Pyruvate, orthophosphate dikinase n=1 Tax=Micromonospora citrea TaxID=47855 RepID=A0A1C6TTK4_9ACTN|nr:pyruvate, phosphate dikinase [Micromonospora citrea]SCL44983.1 pyruvate, orthophosphate dikinase [Micromonospora citrea]
MNWICPLSSDTDESPQLLGGKGHGLVVLRRLGLPVPPGFVIGTHTCRAFLRDGRFPEGLDAELATAVQGLEAATGRRLGAVRRPLVVSVRSGAAVSMPGMMSTILNLGLTTEATAGLAAETGDPTFTREARQRFLTSFTAAVRATADDAAAGTRRSGTAVPDDAMDQLRAAVGAVFASWHTPRATTYRELHDIPHDSGTAVIVQAMVFGNRGEHSGTGVAFSRDPNTGEKTPFGDVLFGRQGEDVVSGRSTTRPLSELAERQPAVWRGLLAALHRVEHHYRDACHVEFTFEAGRLWLLQVRPGGLTGRAAIRVAVDLADEQLIDRRTALRRVSPQHLRNAHTPRIRTGVGLDVLARGQGACPGVAAGRIAVTADRAARMAADGPVVLVRPHTSPLDMHGLAAATGIVTSRGGPTSHAAVVARAMGRPAVVNATALSVDVAGECVRVGERVVAEGTLVTIDGTSGEVVVGNPGTATVTVDSHLNRLLEWADDISGNRSQRPDQERLTAAHARL